MTKDELENLFDKHDHEGHCFEAVQNKTSQRPDIHAFNLLDRLCPADGCSMVSGAAHDQFFLSIDLEQLASVVTEEQVIELRRCGVSCDARRDSLTMYV